MGVVADADVETLFVDCLRVCFLVDVDSVDSVVIMVVITEDDMVAFVEFVVVDESRVSG